MAPLNCGELWCSLHRAVLSDLYLPGASATKLAHVFGSRIHHCDRRRLPLTVERRQGCRLLQRRKRYLLVRTNFEDDMRSSLLVGMEPEILGAGDLPQ